MTVLEKIRLIERAHGFIRRRGTGCPETFARRLGISKRGLYRLLEIMERMDAPIEYNSHRQSYVYTEEVDFTIGFQKIDDENEIKGGKSEIYMLSDSFWH